MATGSAPGAAVSGDETKIERWWDRPVVVLDTETTDADPLKARILQLACLAVYPDGRISPNSLVEIVHTDVPIPDEATKIHGITTARCLADGKPLADVLFETLRRFERWSKASPVLIYNATYDWPLLWEELGRTELVWTEPLAGVQLVDPCVLERHFNGVAKGHYSNKLGEVARRYGIVLPPELGDLHDARADAWLTAGIFRAQMQAYEPLRQLTLPALVQLQREWYAQWRDSLNAYNLRRKRDRQITGEWPFGDRRRQLT